MGAKIVQRKRISASGGRQDECIPTMDGGVKRGRVVDLELLGRDVDVTRDERYSGLLGLRRRSRTGVGGAAGARCRRCGS